MATDINKLTVEITPLDRFEAIKAGMKLSDISALERMFDCVRLMGKDDALRANKEVIRIAHIALTINTLTDNDVHRLAVLIAKTHLFFVGKAVRLEDIAAALLPDSTKSA